MLGRVALALLVAAVAPTAAHANGAFPDAAGLLLPDDQPSEIILVTNFGLVVTRDAGATWFLVCEAAIGTGLVFLYQMGPPPGDTLFAVAGHGIYRSDNACDWSAAGGSLSGVNPVDVFADVTDASHVLAIGSRLVGGGSVSGLFESRDGGRTFGASLLDAPAGILFGSVEIPRTRPGWIYATQNAASDGHPWFVRSRDGATFTTFDELGVAGRATLRIAAVDPTSELNLYVRAEGADTDSLLISNDGGDSFRVALMLGSRMTAFLRRQDGTLLVGDADGRSYRSRDGGRSFSDWPVGVHLRGLGERAGRLYLAVASVAEQFQVAVSDDEGAHLQPLLKLTEMCGPLPCPTLADADACAARWQVLVATLGINGAAACPHTDAAATPLDGSATLVPVTSCGCRAGARPASAPPGAAAIALIAVLGVGRRARRPRARR